MTVNRLSTIAKVALNTNRFSHLRRASRGANGIYCRFEEKQKTIQKTVDIVDDVWHINKAQNASERKTTKCGCGSVVEHLLAKENVVGSNPITRFSNKKKDQRSLVFLFTS